MGYDETAQSKFKWRNMCLEELGHWANAYMMRGFVPYLLTFTFNQLSGKEQVVMRKMAKEVERVYATLLTRIVRNPRKCAAADLPLWIGCPDRPVPKYDQKMSKRAATVNDGLHMHMVAFIPPNSRLSEGLDEHFKQCHRVYCREGHPLRRVHAEPIVDRLEYSVGYAVKAIKRGGIDYDQLLVLPRTRSELGQVCEKAAPQQRRAARRAW